MSPTPQTPPTDRPLTAGDVLKRLMDDYPQLADMPCNAAIWIGGASAHSGDRDPGKVYLDEVRSVLSVRPATSAASEGEATGWLRKAVLHLLPRWGMEGHEVPLPGVRGVQNADHADPRFSVHCYSGHGGNLTVALMVGKDHSRGGVWQEMDFTPEQAVQIAAAILSMPAVEYAAGPLIAALASPPVSERERELEGALRKIADGTYRRGDHRKIAARALTAQPAGEGK